MKYLFIHIEVQDGERKHDHKVLHTTNANNIEFSAQRYVSTYWGKGKREDNWWWWNNEFAGRLYSVTELTLEEYEILNKFI